MGGTGVRCQFSVLSLFGLAWGRMSPGEDRGEIRFIKFLRPEPVAASMIDLQLGRLHALVGGIHET